MGSKPRPLKLPDGLEVQVLDLESLRPAAYNPREIDDEELAGLAESVSGFGLVELPIYNRRTQRLVGGHQRIRVLREKGARQTGVIVGDWTEDEEKELNITLNSPHVRGRFSATLPDLLRQIKDRNPARFASLRLNRLLREHRVRGHSRQTTATEKPAPEPPKKATTKPGDVWELGDHLVLCGDSTFATTWQTLLEGEDPHLIVTDPPYCSGGFQESGKRSGSVGTTRSEKILRDTLSTRGYQALIRTVLGELSRAQVAYIFTDWRMWVNLFDLAEAGGFGVRNMLVWDKGQPGMGQGWRHQHELILVGCRVSNPFDKPKLSRGNVLRHSRTGNRHHETEKPVSLMVDLMSVTDWAELVADPFLGSGSTLLAAEQLGLQCVGAELDPRYCDVVVERWQDLTGKKARRR